MKIRVDDVQDYLNGFHDYGRYAMACCVFHDDHNPSMVITERGYVCKSCGAKGGLGKLYAHVSGRPMQSRKREHNPAAYIWNNWIDKYGSIEAACTFGHTQIMNRPELGNYLYKRGLTIMQIKTGGLGFLGGYYLFPIRDNQNKIQGAIARASPTIQSAGVRYSTSKNCGIKIYVPDWSLLKQSEEIYVCFGVLDVWSLLMAGYPALSSISGQQFDYCTLDEYRKPIYIIADKGEDKSAGKLQSRLGWRGRRLDLVWLEDCKDPNDIHVKFGLEVLRKQIERAKKKYQYDYA